MSKTCIRTLQIAALAGVCMMGSTAQAQSKGGISAKLRPAKQVTKVVQKNLLNQHTTVVNTSVATDSGQATGGGGMAPRGAGGACVLPGGAGCQPVANAAECTDVFFGTYLGDGTGCPVELCGVSGASCQTFEYPRVGGTSFASMGEGNTNLLVLADDFRTSSGGNVNQICWWGAYTPAANPAPIDCNNLAPEVDHFFIRILAMTDQLPDINTVIGSAEQGVSMTVQRRGFCDGPRLTYEYTATLDTAIALQPNTCYAIEIRNPNDNTVNWFWSRSRDIANGQSWQRNGAVPYSSAGVQSPGGDRAFCMNAGLDIFQASCAVPPPPICVNPDSNGYARLGANTGLFSADPSSPGVGLQLANSLVFGTNAPITNVCFWGFWVDPANQQPTGPAVPDFWFTIFDSDGPDGLPGTEIARGQCGVTAGYVSRRNGGLYNIAFPAFNPEPGHCYHFSISFPQDNNDSAHAFRFAWGAALTAANPLSNFYVASRIANPPGAWAFQNFGDSTIAETSMVFDQPGQLPACGAPPPPPPPPANDNCAAAIAIAGTGTFNFDNRSATVEVGEPAASCGTSGNSIWYTWTPACDGTYTISMCAGSGADNLLAVYDGSACFSGAEIACGDDTCGIGGGPSTVTIIATGGSAYKVRVADWTAAEGGTSVGSAGTFEISRDGGGCTQACPCDFNNNQVLNSQDFFDFLACFFTNGCADADYNNDLIVNSQDFFDFLSCFFAPPAGC